MESSLRGCDNHGCCQPCRECFSEGNVAGGGVVMRRQQWQESPRSMYDLHNFELVPTAPSAIRGCRGKGRNAYEDCPFVRVNGPCGPAREVGPETATRNDDLDEAFLQGYLSDLMSRPAESFQERKRDPYPFQCCGEGGRHSWMAFPPDECTASEMKRVLESTMKADCSRMTVPQSVLGGDCEQVTSSRLPNSQSVDMDADPVTKPTNMNRTSMSPSQHDPSTVDVRGCPVTSITSKPNSQSPTYSNSANFQGSRRPLHCQPCSKQNDLGSCGSETKVTAECVAEGMRPIGLRSTTSRVSSEGERGEGTGLPHCSGCAAQGASMGSGRNWRWGGCRDPVKTRRCLGDPRRGHMVRRPCGEVWHCADCCRMMRQDAALQSLTLLRRSDSGLALAAPALSPR